MPRKKILLVDDASTILMMERMILCKGPYDLVTAKDGREAVEIAQREHPDLILMDVVMPNLNGFEACREIRGIESLAAVPIVMVTTRAEAENIEKGYESGCNDYVTKPISSVELLSKVRDLIGD